MKGLLMAAAETTNKEFYFGRLLECQVCGYGKTKVPGDVWICRVDHRPAACPKCKNPRWDKEKIRTILPENINSAT